MSFLSFDPHHDVVHENEHYVVMVGESEMNDDQDRTYRVYKVVNKQWGVVELETSWLVKALYESDEWAKGLEHHKSMTETNDSPLGTDPPDGFSSPAPSQIQ